MMREACIGAAWDRQSQTLAIRFVAGGRETVVSVPVSVVDRALDVHLNDAGIVLPAELGYLPSVDGFLQRARRAVARFGKKAGRAVARTYKTARRVAQKALRSPIGKAIMAGAALAMPAVGGPALAALAAANRVRRMVDDASRGSESARRALPGIQTAARRLAAGSDPVSRVAVAALRSL